MIDKEKIRKEVERLKSNLIHGACSSQIAMETSCKEEAYNDVLAILDSLQEETISKGQVKKSVETQHVNETCKEKVNSLTQEPVSEELEEAARKIATRHSHISGDTYYANDAWFFKKGAQWHKEQMMAKAIDAHCFGFQGDALFSFRLPADNYLVGSEVKVIIIEK